MSSSPYNIFSAPFSCRLRAEINRRFSPEHPCIFLKKIEGKKIRKNKMDVLMNFSENQVRKGDLLKTYSKNGNHKPSLKLTS